MAIKANPSFLTTSATVPASTKSQIALSKFPMLTVVTNAGNSSGSTSWTVPGGSLGYKSGVELVNVLGSSCDTVNVGSDGSVSVAFTGGQPKVR